MAVRREPAYGRRMALELRTSADGSLDMESWLNAVHTGFHRTGRLDEEQIRARQEVFDVSRLQGIFDDGRCVATYRSFDQRLTVPGGADVGAHAVTAVTVTATHRRRGLLHRMMTADLRAAKEQGEVVSTLIAAEHGIYGRFGYGPATVSGSVEVDGLRTGLDGGRVLGEREGSITFADGAEVRKAGPELHERFRRRRAGATDRSAGWWRAYTGEVRLFPEWKEPFQALYRDAAGVVQGLATFDVENKWTGHMPAGTATVRDLLATTVAAERALWHFVLSMDWVTRLVADRLPPDALLPELLPEPRAAQFTEASDFLWLRPLDVPGMLTGRCYPTEGELVLEVTDPMGLADGRFLLTASPEGAECVATTRGADLTLDTGALGTLYLGDRPASRLVALGRATEETPGAAARADRLLYTAERPWAYDIF